MEWVEHDILYLKWGRGFFHNKYGYCTYNIWLNWYFILIVYSVVRIGMIMYCYFSGHWQGAPLKEPNFFQDASCITSREPPIYLDYFKIYICSSDAKNVFTFYIKDYLKIILIIWIKLLKFSIMLTRISVDNSLSYFRSYLDGRPHSLLL